MENKDVEMVEGVSKTKKRSLGRQCAAYGCYNTFYKTDGSPSGLHFFRFPQKNPEKLRWCNLIKRADGRDDFNVTLSTFLCEEHFTDADISRYPNQWRLKSGAVPSLNLFSSVDRLPRVSRKAPAERTFSSSASATAIFDDDVSPLDSNVMESSLQFSTDDSPSTSVSTQTEFSFISSPIYIPSSYDQNKQCDHEYSSYTSYENDLFNICNQHDHLSTKTKELSLQVDKLSKQIGDLEQQMSQLKSSLFSIDKLEKDDAAVRFYTGFQNFSSLHALFEYFQPKLDRIHYWRGPTSSKVSDLSYQQSSQSQKPGPKRSLSQLEEFIFVLMRLKVGLFMNDLSDRFGISTGHASKIFTSWINFLFHELPLLFPFPSQERIRKDMPQQFKDYPSTRIIIDCTEIFTEIPSSLKSQSQTWSQYKHHNTWKALVGISPTGCITFVSKLWSGRVSDKEITQKCGVLQLLEDGDNIMADRGFDISNILPPGVSLNIPPFKGTRIQLTAEETEETARIAAVRIHVERAIGRVKNFHILDGVISLSLQPILNQIFSVCCLLTNFQPFLVQNSNNKSE